jgi:hypothetical protein
LYQRKKGQLYLVQFEVAVCDSIGWLLFKTNFAQAIYYNNYTCDYDPHNLGNCPSKRQARAFPPGFRMIAGQKDRTTFNPGVQSNVAIRFNSGGHTGVHRIPEVVDQTLLAAVRFPSCWDGDNIDSKDHQSHVAYPDPALRGNTEGGMCPKSHPYALFQIGAEFIFDTSDIRSEELVFSNGDTTGYGFHADFLQGWQDLAALQRSFQECSQGGPNDCPWLAFGTPDGKIHEEARRDPEVLPKYEEEVGLNGPVSKLPGPNPIRPRRF